MAEPRLAGVVPASGSSRRMGRPKATLLLEGRTFLERVTEALRAGGCDPVIVVVNPLDRVVSGEARRLEKEGRVCVLENSDPGEGPITSMRLALARLPEEVDGMAWLPVDFPLVDAAVVTRLREAATSSGAPLTLPMHGEKRGHPAVFRRLLFGELEDPALDGGARTVVHRHLEAACLVAFADAAVTTDVDTPDVYAELLERAPR